jgi:hypothetical protein
MYTTYWEAYILREENIKYIFIHPIVSQCLRHVDKAEFFNFFFFFFFFFFFLQPRFAQRTFGGGNIRIKGIDFAVKIVPPL